MARHLLYKTINVLAGDFIEGLKEEDLKIGVSYTTGG